MHSCVASQLRKIRKSTLIRLAYQEQLTNYMKSLDNKLDMF